MLSKTNDWRHHVDSLVELFKEDLPSPLSAPSELHMWSFMFTNCDQSMPPNSPLQALIQCDYEIVPNIFRLLKIVATVPMTTCDAERSFLGLGRLKMFIRTDRTTTREDRLNELALLHIHRNVNTDLYVAVDEFARRHNRRVVAYSVNFPNGGVPCSTVPVAIKQLQAGLPYHPRF